METAALTKAASEVATALSVLRTAAELDKAKLALGIVERIIELLNTHYGSLREHGPLFTQRPNHSTVTVHGIHYSSAHLAAFGEAGLCLESLWFHLDPEGHEAAGKLSKHELLPELLRIRANGTGMDPQQIVDDWEQTKAGILDLLTPDWKQDFSVIRARIPCEVPIVNVTVAGQTSSPAADSTSKIPDGNPPNEADAILPVWDEKSGNLTFDGKAARHYEKRAYNCIAILDVFQLEGWPVRVDDPLPNGKNPERLSNTIKTLNTGLQTIEFFSGGDGQSTGWRKRELTEN